MPELVHFIMTKLLHWLLCIAALIVEWTCCTDPMLCSCAVVLYIYMCMDTVYVLYMQLLNGSLADITDSEDLFRLIEVTQYSD